MQGGTPAPGAAKRQPTRPPPPKLNEYKNWHCRLPEVQALAARQLRCCFLLAQSGGDAAGYGYRCAGSLCPLGLQRSPSGMHAPCCAVPAAAGAALPACTLLCCPSQPGHGRVCFARSLALRPCLPCGCPRTPPAGLAPCACNPEPHPRWARSAANQAGWDRNWPGLAGVCEEGLAFAKERKGERAAAMQACWLAGWLAGWVDGWLLAG